MTGAANRGRRPEPGGSTSRSLLAHALLADPVAWERAVRLYAPLVAYWCRRWGVATQDIGDVVQEVFAAVARHLAGFKKERPGDTFRGWLATITHNKVRDYLRRRAAEPAATGGSEAAQRLNQIPDPQRDAVADPEIEGSLGVLYRQALASIRDEFHERTWRAFWCVVVDGRETLDVASELDMKPGAVRVAKSRVLARLRRELGDAPP